MRLPAPAYRQAGAGREFGLQSAESKILKTAWSHTYGRQWAWRRAQYDEFKAETSSLRGQRKKFTGR